MGKAQYEFNEDENQVLGAAARWMGVLGWIFVVIGVFVGLPVFAGHYLFLPGAAFLIFAGLLTVRASRSFGLVTTTDGNDIDHLLDAVDSLRRLYRMQVLVLAIGFVIALVIGFLGYLAT